MSRLVFLDTETTGLALDDDIWEVAMIVREPGEPDTEMQFFVEHDRKKSDALPESFRADHDARYNHGEAYSRSEAASAVSLMTAGAHIVGAVPNFDTERLSLLLRTFRRDIKWHYHLIDVENLAVGYLAGRAARGDLDAGLAMPDLPWSSDALSAACGVEPPTSARHTALGDARWARDLYDAIMLGAAVSGE